MYVVLQMLKKKKKLKNLCRFNLISTELKCLFLIFSDTFKVKDSENIFREKVFRYQS